MTEVDFDEMTGFEHANVIATFLCRLSLMLATYVCVKHRYRLANAYRKLLSIPLNVVFQLLYWDVVEKADKFSEKIRETSKKFEETCGEHSKVFQQIVELHDVSIKELADTCDKLSALANEHSDDLLKSLEENLAEAKKVVEEERRELEKGQLKEARRLFLNSNPTKIPMMPNSSLKAKYDRVVNSAMNEISAY